MVDSNRKPAIGFIYEATDQVKKKIQKAFNIVRKRYVIELSIYLLIKLVVLKLQNVKLTQCNIFWLVIYLCGTSLMKGGQAISSVFACFMLFS